MPARHTSPRGRPAQPSGQGPVKSALDRGGGQQLILVGPLMNPPAHAPPSAGTSAEPSTAALDTEDEWAVTRNGEALRSGLFLIIPPIFLSRCSLRLIFKSTARLPLAQPDCDPAKCHQTRRHSYVSPQGR